MFPVGVPKGAKELGGLGTIKRGKVGEDDRVAQISKIGRQGVEVAMLEGRHPDLELTQKGSVGYSDDGLIDKLLVGRSDQNVVIGLGIGIRYGS